MTPTILETMKQALEAMHDHGTSYLNHEDEYATAIDCLRAAIKQYEEAEPFCWLKQTTSTDNPPHGWAVHFNGGEVPLFTHPAPAVPEGWQPIETAPKDGTEIIVRDGVGGVHGAKWTSYRGRTDWCHHCNLGWLPSARWWMPMPPTPSNVEVTSTDF